MVEILVVIAISVILFGLLIRPVVDTLRYTQDAQTHAAAQDAARITMEQMTREINSASYIFDNTGTYISNQNNAKPTTVNASIMKYTNFLNVDVPQVDGSDNYKGQVPAHLYDAKLDLVMVRHADNVSNLQDPTAGYEPIKLGNDTKNDKISVISPTDLRFPLAPGTTVIRYFVGLQDPTKPYHNDRDHIGKSNDTNNTYVLYRAQFQPYVSQPGVGTVVNESLFVKSSTGSVGYDDPDFFRTVSTSDVNWLNPSHNYYNASEVQDHNNRLNNWIKIAKRVVDIPQIDLLILPHNNNRTIKYTDPATAPTNLKGVAFQSIDFDPVIGGDPTGGDKGIWPVVLSSMKFRPGSTSGDAAPATTGEYDSMGVAGSPNTDINLQSNGFRYIPSVYQTTGSAWANPFTITMYPTFVPFASTTSYFTITQSDKSETISSVIVKPGDIVEYYYQKDNTNNWSSSPVYDVTQGVPIQNSNAVGQCIPVVINQETGTLTFAVPAIPDPAQQYTTKWAYVVANDGTVNLTSPDISNNASPLSNTTLYQNAMVVPGSVRVYGPGDTNNPDALYKEIADSSELKDNEYRVDYSTGIITFPTGTIGKNVHIIYDFQCNYRPQDASKPIAADNPIYPYAVRVDYRNRSVVDLNIGVRFIDSNGNSQSSVLANSVKVGNINR